MSAFEYTALDGNGRLRKGISEGDNAREIRRQLREQALTPVSVEEVIPKNTRRRRRVRVGSADMSLLTRQLATLVRVGLPLEEALHTVARQTEKRKVQSMLMGVRTRVNEGHTLAQSLREFPEAFPEVYCATVAAGEQSGRLDTVLEHLADYLENRRMMRQKILPALFYPIILTVVAIFVVTALLAYVVPQVVQIFTNVQQQLPLLTRILIAFSDFINAWGLWLLGGIVLLVIGLRYALRFPAMRRAWHRLLLALPMVSRLERGIHMARFTRTMSMLSAGGVPLLDALQITAQLMSNQLLRNAVNEAANRVREGGSLHLSLSQTGLFPPMVINLIAGGEAGGNLEKMLERAALNQERELETYTSILLSLFEPLLILIMGGIVLAIVVAILLPVFELNRLIK